MSNTLHGEVRQLTQAEIDAEYGDQLREMNARPSVTKSFVKFQNAENNIPRNTNLDDKRTALESAQHQIKKFVRIENHVKGFWAAKNKQGLKAFMDVYKLGKLLLVDPCNNVQIEEYLLASQSANTRSDTSAFYYAAYMAVCAWRTAKGDGQSTAAKWGKVGQYCADKELADEFIQDKLKRDGLFKWYSEIVELEKAANDNDDDPDPDPNEPNVGELDGVSDGFKDTSEYQDCLAALKTLDAVNLQFVNPDDGTVVGAFRVSSGIAQFILTKEIEEAE